MTYLYVQFTCHEERTWCRGYEGVGHRAACDDCQNIEEIISPCPRGKSLGKGNHEVKDRVEENGYAQDEAAARKGVGGSFLPTQLEGGANDAVGSPAFQQAGADDGCHGDDETNLGASPAEAIGDAFSNGLICQSRCFLYRLTLFVFPMPEQVLLRCQETDHEGGQREGQKGVKP